MYARTLQRLLRDPEAAALWAWLWTEAPKGAASSAPRDVVSAGYGPALAHLAELDLVRFNAVQIVVRSVPPKDDHEVFVVEDPTPGVWFAVRKRKTFVLSNKPGKAPEELTLDERAFLAWLWPRYLELMGYSASKLEFVPWRQQVALARFREGFGRDDFDAVMQWASQDPWLRGDNPTGRRYDDFDTLFGPKKFTKYLKQAQTSRPTVAHALAPSARPVEGRRL